MGRKIPGKKHRTIKDPEVQRSKREHALKGKINNPPSKIDHQEMPKSVLNIMHLKEKAKQFGRNRKRNRQKNKYFDMGKAVGKELIQPGMERPDKPIPVMSQDKNEHPAHYIRRLTKICDDVLHEARFEEQFNVEVKRDESGHVSEVSGIKRIRRSKKPKLSEKRKNRELEKRKQNELQMDFPQRENIEFGDIVHRPPQLTIPKKVAKRAEENKRPGKKNLLLKQVMHSDKGKTVGKTVKKMTAIERQKQELRRKSVVEAFRTLKREKRMQLN